MGDGGKKNNSILSFAVPLAVGLLTGGTGFALAPWFGSTATGALLGGGASGLLSGGKPNQWLSAAGMGALGGAGGAGMGSNLFGANAIRQAGYAATAGDIGRSMGYGLGTGTAAGSMAASGAGTLLGGLGTFGNQLAKNTTQLLATNALSTLLNPNAQSKQPTYDNYVPASYQRFNSATPTTGSVQTIKPTPSPITGWSSAEQKSNLIDKSLSNFDMLIPGRNRQSNIYTWS
jgi:hypothetical protein